MVVQDVVKCHKLEQSGEILVSILEKAVEEGQFVDVEFAAAAVLDGLEPCSAGPIPSSHWVSCRLPFLQTP